MTVSQHTSPEARSPAGSGLEPAAPEAPAHARPSVPLRRELLTQFGLLFGASLLLAGAGLITLLPVLSSPRQAALFVALLLALDLVVIFVFGGGLLERVLVQPVEQLVEDVRRIAAGDYRHRVGAVAGRELEALRESVNEMADRLIQDQDLLAGNIDSLDRTNQELVAARNEVIRTARLATVGTLAAGIAHEVGNPLGAILGYVDLARRRAEKAGGDTEVLEAIRDEARRIDKIVRGLLDYARHKTEEMQPVHPAEVLLRVRALLENQGRLADVTHVWELEEDVPLVSMVPQRFEQVMVNLLLNALDALDGHPDPRITIALHAEPGDVMRLPVRREGDPPGINYMHRRRISRDEGGRGVDPLFTATTVVVVSVLDNGTGIREEDIARVFDPFFTTKEPGKGTGLGLAICARLIEGMGGRIDVANRPEGGAHFSIRLPEAAAEAGR